MGSNSEGCYGVSIEKAIANQKPVYSEEQKADCNGDNSKLQERTGAADRLELLS